MNHALAFVLAAALCGSAHAVDVYKWTDGKGVVHYGDRPASGAAASTVSVPGGGSSAEEVEAADASLQAARDKLDTPVRSGRRRYSGVATPAPQKAQPTGCAALWNQYDSAQACFDAHRVAGGKGVTNRGASTCKEVPQPTCAR